MTFEAWALFCLTETLLCLQPGPSSLLVFSLGMTRGRAAGIAATVGVLAANAMYFALSATSLAAALNLSAQVFVVIKWAGAAYLIWIGARMIVRSFRSQAGASNAAAPASSRGAFWQGFMTQGANPNLLVYFTAILPQFINAGAPLGGQVMLLALSSFAIEFTVLTVYATLANHAGR